MRFVLKIELGGLAGIVAPMIGKAPPEIQIWIIGGIAPAFVRDEGPLYRGGPIWIIELTSPVWPGLPRSAFRFAHALRDPCCFSSGSHTPSKGRAMSSI